ncbi:hypothetical protein D3C77_248200 [compost metagenome]
MQHQIDHELAGLRFAPLQAVRHLLTLLLTLMLIRLGWRIKLVEIADTLLLKLVHHTLELFLLLIQLLFIAEDCLLQTDQRRGRILYICKLRDRSLGDSVVFDSHVHGQLVGSLQRQLRVTQITFCTMGGIVALDTQKVDLVDQGLTDTVDEDRTFHQVVESRLRQTRQQLFLVDGFGKFLCKAAQASQCTARIDMQYSLGQTSKVRQQFIAGAEEFEID